MLRCLLVTILLSLPCLVPSQDTCSIPNGARIDCHPEFSTKPDEIKKKCEGRGCCWREARGDTLPGPDVATPWCYFPTDYANYDIDFFETSKEVTTIQLRKTSRPSGFPDDSSKVSVTVTPIHNDVLRVKISDPLNPRFEVPEPVLNVKPTHTEDKKYQVAFNNETGILQVIRTSTNKPLFSTNVKKLIFSNQFLQLTVADLPSDSLYGLGENMDSFRKNFTRFKRVIIMNRDEAPVSHLPLYGTHPFYLMPESELDSHGVLLFNNHPQEIIFNPSSLISRGEGGPALTFRTIGGILDFYLFLGPGRNDILRQKAELIGHTPLPPRWGLGFQLCRFGYKNTTHISDTYSRNVNAGIPLDVQWIDIDYMDRRNDFTVDRTNFSGLSDFVKRVHNDGRKFIPILDPAVSGSEPKGTYPPFDEGVQMDIFVKNPDGSLFTGKVWNPDTSIFPDFTHPRAGEYWTQQMKRLSDQLDFDGIWIDMNEPANLIDGEKGKGCDTKDKLNNPPFIPGADKGIYLYKKSMCPSTRHHLGPHYDLHNMYGFFEAKATNQALKVLRQGKRPFIVSRATVTGQNRYSNHWTGDVFSTWEHLRNSIPDMLSMNLFGMSMVGADICGFNGNTDVELCARWSSLGAFYPFSRNHNSDDARDQDPVSLGQVVVDAAKNALQIRYSLLPYLYTVFYENSKTGHPVVRSIEWDHPWDEKAVEVETQFMWGNGIMLIPALQVHERKVTGYFPTQTKWYDYHTLKKLKEEGEEDRLWTFNAPLDGKPSLAIRGKSIIPYHTKTGVSTHEQRDSPFGLILALCSCGRATGQLYWDDGESEDSITLGQYLLVKFEAKEKALKSIVTNPGFTTSPLTEIKILGVENQVDVVTVNGTSVKFHFIPEKEHLILSDLNINLSQPFEVKWN